MLCFGFSGANRFKNIQMYIILKRHPKKLISKHRRTPSPVKENVGDSVTANQVLSNEEHFRYHAKESDV